MSISIFSIERQVVSLVYKSIKKVQNDTDKIYPNLLQDDNDCMISEDLMFTIFKDRLVVELKGSSSFVVYLVHSLYPKSISFLNNDNLIIKFNFEDKTLCIKSPRTDIQNALNVFNVLLNKVLDRF
jgi:uncharacterized protein YqkB